MERRTSAQVNQNSSVKLKTTSARTALLITRAQCHARGQLEDSGWMFRNPQSRRRATGRGIRTISGKQVPIMTS